MFPQSDSPEVVVLTGSPAVHTDTADDTGPPLCNSERQDWRQSDPLDYLLLRFLRNGLAHATQNNNANVLNTRVERCKRQLFCHHERCSPNRPTISHRERSISFSPHRPLPHQQSHSCMIRGTQVKCFRTQIAGEKKVFWTRVAASFV